MIHKRFELTRCLNGAGKKDVISFFIMNIREERIEKSYRFSTGQKSVCYLTIDEGKSKKVIVKDSIVYIRAACLHEEDMIAAGSVEKLKQKVTCRVNGLLTTNSPLSVISHIDASIRAKNELALTTRDKENTQITELLAGLGKEKPEKFDDTEPVDPQLVEMIANYKSGDEEEEKPRSMAHLFGLSEDYEEEHKKKAEEERLQEEEERLQDKSN